MEQKHPKSISGVITLFQSGWHRTGLHVGHATGGREGALGSHLVVDQCCPLQRLPGAHQAKGGE